MGLPQEDLYGNPVVFSAALDRFNDTIMRTQNVGVLRINP